MACFDALLRHGSSPSLFGLSRSDLLLALTSRIIIEAPSRTEVDGAKRLAGQGALQDITSVPRM